MKVSKGRSKHAFKNSIEQSNKARVRLGGRIGSKHFQDPRKLFIGNIPYDADENVIKKFFTTHIGANVDDIVVRIKIVRDWRSGKSKGYGFIDFTEPIYATSMLMVLRNKKLKGRIVRFEQGKKKGDDENRQVFVEHRARRMNRVDGRDTHTDAELRIIDLALDEAEKWDKDAKTMVEEDAKPMVEEAVVVTGDDESDDEETTYAVDDFDGVDDALLLDEEIEGDDSFDEDDFFEDDGEGGDEYLPTFEETYKSARWQTLDEEEAKNMNRKERREAIRLKGLKPLPFKGFSDGK